MSLVRWKSGQDLLSMEKELNSLFDMLNPFGRKSAGEEGYDQSSWAPLSDIMEDKDHFILLLDLPGVNRDEVKLSVADNRLIISGERKAESESKDRNYHRVERITGKFYRSFLLPDQVKTDQISAEFANGQLTIRIPKQETVKPREIPIVTHS